VDKFQKHCSDEQNDEKLLHSCKSAFSPQKFSFFISLSPLSDILSITWTSGTLTVATCWQLNRFQPRGSPNVIVASIVDTIPIITSITTQITE
jgi:hypothetical protein